MRRIRITKPCPICGQMHFVEVDTRQLDAYYAGALIQDAFPDLSDDERERLKTGICKDCWDDLFDDEEDDEEYMPSAEDLREWQDASCGRC